MGDSGAKLSLLRAWASNREDVRKGSGELYYLITGVALIVLITWLGVLLIKDGTGKPEVSTEPNSNAEGDD